MKVEMQQEGTGKVRLQVEVSQPEVAAAFGRAVTKVARQVNVPGFRKGKAPRPILERFVGKEALRREAMELVVPHSYVAALEELRVEPVDDPEISLDQEQLWDDRPLTFEAVVTIRPTVELREYGDLHLDLPPVGVSSREVDETLEYIRRRRAQLVPEEAVGENCVALLEVEYRKGEAKPVLEPARWINLERETLLPGLREALLGARADEERELETTIPEGFGPPEDVGKPLHLVVRIKEVKREELPALDDDFAKELDFETLQELRADLENNLRKQAEVAAREGCEEDLLKLLRERADVLIPEVMINRELDHLRGNVDERYPAPPEEELRRRAEERVYNELVLEAVARQEGIEVTPAEVEGRLNRLARTLNKEPAAFKESLSPEQRRAVQRAIVAEKALHQLLDRALAKE